MTGTGIIDQFLETFTRYIDNGFGLLGSDVGYLATTLAAIDITLAALFWSWGPDEDIVARLLYPVVNEGAKVLEEGVAIRASDIDVACILGYNWPVYTGGPMFWADTVGLPRVVEGLKAMGIEPAKLLVEKAAAGGSFTRG